jgi:predicted nucleic acid-binding protein
VAVIGDTSAIVDYLYGRGSQAIEEAILAETLVLPPLVIAELLSGSNAPLRRAEIADVVKDLPMHSVELPHWIAVGNLRHDLKRHGLNVTIPDAHIAQCALERDVPLLTRDAIFLRIAEYVPLRLG